MKMKIANNQLPVGGYECSFDGAEESTHEVYGDGLRWCFTVERGKHRSAKAYRTTKPEPTPKNSCGRFLAALAGKPPTDGLEIDLDDYIGRRYSVIVGESEGGSTRVESFARMSDDDTADDEGSNCPFDIPPE